MDTHAKKTDDVTSDHNLDPAEHTKRTAVDLEGMTPQHIEPLVPQKKKSKKRPLIIVTLVLVVLIIAAVLSYFLVILPTAQKAKDTKVSTPTHFSSLSALVSQAASDTKGDALQALTMNGLGGTTADGYFAYSLPAYRPDGTQFQTQPVEGTGSGYSGDSATAAADYKKFTDFFAANNFKRTTSQDGDTGYISQTDTAVFTTYAIYESDDTICSVWNADASGTKIANHVASIGCAKKDSYKQASAALTPFFTAYTKANSASKPSDLVFGTPAVQDGADDYKNATVFQADPTKTENNGRNFFSGLYYLTPNSSAWTYVASADGTPDCTIYATDILKKAFSGTSCFDSTAKKTISVK